ncbi:golgin subfamily a member 6-like protein [Anaeramoeba flamelloides]|uniref:Golgin subfamily a member 6-like protein n=1 Tax=Anaeramoeba flamelloides TaxID=1746091 RepID=A0ABQ8XU65_9EUKA|nr:golgin subfamily a member 6-like protein [Anaeramoeba flamelloides]
MKAKRNEMEQRKTKLENERDDMIQVRNKMQAKSEEMQENHKQDEQIKEQDQRIDKQNEQIKEQNLQIDKQDQRIKEQNLLIKEQNNRIDKQFERDNMSALTTNTKDLSIGKVTKNHRNNNKNTKLKCPKELERAQKKTFGPLFLKGIRPLKTSFDNLTSCLFSHLTGNPSEETRKIFNPFQNNNNNNDDEMMKLIFLCGASGVGKTWTLIDFAFQNYSLSFFTLSVHSGRKIL